MIGWRDALFKTISAHIRRDSINIGARGAVLAWWIGNYTQIFGEVEAIIDDETASEVLGELNSLATIIGADARIDNDDPNTQRIIQIIDIFINEIEQEADFTDDEDKE